MTTTGQGAGRAELLLRVTPASLRSGCPCDWHYGQLQAPDPHVLSLYFLSAAAGVTSMWTRCRCRGFPSALCLNLLSVARTESLFLLWTVWVLTTWTPTLVAISCAPLPTGKDDCLCPTPKAPLRSSRNRARRDSWVSNAGMGPVKGQEVAPPGVPVQVIAGAAVELGTSGRWTGR